MVECAVEGLSSPPFLFFLLTTERKGPLPLGYCLSKVLVPLVFILYYSTFPCCHRPVTLYTGFDFILFIMAPINAVRNLFNSQKSCIASLILLYSSTEYYSTVGTAEQSYKKCQARYSISETSLPAPQIMISSQCFLYSSSSSRVLYLNTQYSSTSTVPEYFI
jgi:hypothetical protein